MLLFVLTLCSFNCFSNFSCFAAPTTVAFLASQYFSASSSPNCFIPSLTLEIHHLSSCAFPFAFLTFLVLLCHPPLLFLHVIICQHLLPQIPTIPSLTLEIQDLLVWYIPFFVTFCVFICFSNFFPFAALPTIGFLACW